MVQTRLFARYLASQFTRSQLVESLAEFGLDGTIIDGPKESALNAFLTDVCSRDASVATRMLSKIMSELITRMGSVRSAKQRELNEWFNVLQAALSTSGMRFVDNRIVPYSSGSGRADNQVDYHDLERVMMSDRSSNVYAVVLCAVLAEYESLQVYLPPRERLLGRGSIGYKANLVQGGPTIVVLQLQEMGNLSAALETQRAIDVWNPKYLILAGIAGGFAKADRYLGDVVVADQLIYYELAKESEVTTALRPQVFRSSAKLISAAQALAREPFSWLHQIRGDRPDGTSGRVIPKVHVGSVLSGEKVVASSSFLREFREVWTGIVGVEMEGAGAGLAVYRSETQPEFLMVKAICDWADKTKDDGWQRYAAHASAAFVTALLDKLANVVKQPSFGEEPRQYPQRQKKVTCTGPERFEICDRLYGGWQDIADYYDIPKRERARFRAGGEMIEVWEWLAVRGNLDSLPATLRRLKREDVIRDFPCLLAGNEKSL